MGPGFDSISMQIALSYEMQKITVRKIMTRESFVEGACFAQFPSVGVQ